MKSLISVFFLAKKFWQSRIMTFGLRAIGKTYQITQNAQSRFASVVLNWVLCACPPGCILVSPYCQKLLSRRGWGLLKANAVSAQNALHWSKTKKRALIEGPKGKPVFTNPTRGSLLLSSYHPAVGW